MPNRNVMTDAVESKVASSDSVKVTTTSLQFGPVTMFRGPEVPPASFGRNGDIFILDSTAIPDDDLQSGLEPPIASLYQRRPDQVPSGPVSFRSADGGLLLNPGDGISINGDPIVFTGGNLESLATDITNQTAGANSPIVAQVVASQQRGTPGGAAITGDILGIDLGAGITNVTFTIPFTAQGAANQINAVGIPGLIANVVQGALVLTAPGGEPITLSDTAGAPTTNLGPFTFQGGALDLTETVGDAGFLFSTPVGPTGVAFLGTVANQTSSPLVLGGRWVELGEAGTLFQTILEPARLATTVPLPNGPVVYNNGVSGIGATLTATANGALTIDGVLVNPGDRLVIKDQANPIHDGVYEVTQPGDGSNPFILTRTVDADEGTTELINGAVIVVTDGITNADTIWLVTSPSDPINIGVSDIFFATLGATVTSIQLIDNDSNTRITVEDSFDDNTIRFDVGDNTTLYDPGTLTNQLQWSAQQIAIRTADHTTNQPGGGMFVQLGSGGGVGPFGGGGSFALIAGNGRAGSNAFGGGITMRGGTGDGSGSGGDIALFPGGPGATGTPGRFNLFAWGFGPLESSEMRWFAPGNANYVGFQAPNATTNPTFRWPGSDGSANDVLTTDGAGNLSFAPPAGGSPDELIDADNNTYIRVDNNPSGDTNTITMGVGDNSIPLQFTTQNLVDISNFGGVNIRGADNVPATSFINDGGSVRLFGGLGAEIGAGGNIELTSGVGGSLGGNMGNILLTVPPRPATQFGPGGNIDLTAGDTDTASGGLIRLIAGGGGTTGDGGDIQMTGGLAGTAGGNGGDIRLAGAPVVNPTGDAGNFLLLGGFSQNGQGGIIELNPGNSGVGQLGYIQISPASTGPGNTSQLRFVDSTGGLPVNYVGFRAPDVVVTDTIWTLPDQDGAAGEVLTTDGSANLSWSTGAGNVTQIIDADANTYVRVDTSPISTDPNAVTMRIHDNNLNYNTGIDVFSFSVLGFDITTPDSTTAGFAAPAFDVSVGNTISDGAALITGSNLTLTAGGITLPTGFVAVTGGIASIRAGEIGAGTSAFFQFGGQAELRGGDIASTPVGFTAAFAGNALVQGGTGSAGGNVNGGTAQISGGDGTGTAGGGGVSITTGNGSTSGNFNLVIPTSSNGFGGVITINAGDAGTAGGGGGFTVNAGDGAGTNSPGGTITMVGGIGAGTGGNSQGGNFNMTSGVGFPGGNFNMTSGNAAVGSNGFAGLFNIRGGAGDGAGGGGFIGLTPGRGGATGTDGAVFIGPPLGQVGGGRSGQLQFLESNTAGFPLAYVGFRAPDTLAGSTDYIWPGADGNANDVLTTDGAGNMSWAPATGGAAQNIQGTRASPILVTAATTIPLGTLEVDNIIFIEGNAGPQIMTANPQIDNGTAVGQRVTIISRDATNTVEFAGTGLGMELNGNNTMAESDVMTLIWDGTAWIEISRNN